MVLTAPTRTHSAPCTSCQYIRHKCTATKEYGNSVVGLWRVESAIDHAQRLKLRSAPWCPGASCARFTATCLRTGARCKPVVAFDPAPCNACWVRGAPACQRRQHLPDQAPRDLVNGAGWFASGNLLVVVASSHGACIF